MRESTLLPAAVALACGLALAACGTPAAPDGGPFTGPGAADYYPTGTAFAAHPPPEPPACLRSPEGGFALARAFSPTAGATWRSTSSP